jgi:small subunit ribosomal protein S16
MLKIKLARFGKKGQPHYRIVVNEDRDKRDGSSVALLGHYAPTQQPKSLEIDVKAYQEWVAKGAQPTDTVAGLFSRLQSGTPFPAKTKPRVSKKAKAKQLADQEAEAAAKAAKAEAAAKPAEVVTEPTEVATEAAPEVTPETDQPAA